MILYGYVVEPTF